ncbi:hypothetical protein COSO111634_09180 [Corallococcus soli]
MPCTSQRGRGGVLAAGMLPSAPAQAGLPVSARSHQVRYFEATVLIGASFARIDTRETVGEVGVDDDSDAEAK